VADGADVDVGFLTYEIFFSHADFLLKKDCKMMPIVLYDLYDLTVFTMPSGYSLEASYSFGS
ncbi:MAG: hypothetical protein LUC93_15410, partial [Planctomycetaceae bacterium]|nr:hypothetical protein [Planctomycetaceae bacterium]